MRPPPRPLAEDGGKLTMRSESRSLSLLRCQGLSTEYCLLGHSSAPRSSEIISMKTFLCLLGENEGRRDSIILSGHTSLLSNGATQFLLLEALQAFSLPLATGSLSPDTQHRVLASL